MDEFYIGYLKQAPTGLRAFLRKLSLGLVVIGGVVAALVVFGQQAFYPSAFEFLDYRTFEGIVYERPYPLLVVERPGEAGEATGASQYYLVRKGKFGAQAAVAGLDGRPVRLEGTLIYRDDQTMIELRKGSDLTPLGEASPMAAASERSLGTFTFVGEIVDSKCFLGVMNPGSTKPHRACARRCISGGVPPLFLVQDAQGETIQLLLQGSEGQMINQEVLDYVAEPLEITGEVVRLGNLLVLKAAPESYRRVRG